MARQHVLAIDEGTTGVGAFLFDSTGKAVARAEEDFPQHFPQPGWVEHDAEQIWEATLRVVRAALKQAKLKPEAVSALGITNQRETVVAWDARSGRPVHRAIVWQDRRTAGTCEALAAQGHAAEVRERTGLVLDPYFSATKIRWMLDHVPEVADLARAGHLRVGTIDSWLVHKLTAGKVHATDVSNASRTLLMDLGQGAWHDGMLDLFGVPRSALPQIVPSSGEAGRTAREVLGAEIPIAGLAGDQQAALFGQTCFAPGESKNTYGTGSFLLVNTGSERPRSEKLLATAAWDVGGKRSYALEGSVFVTGAAVQWLRDGLGIISNAEETEVLARRVPDAGGVWFVPALTGLGAPHWDPHARGTILGLTRGTTKAHLVRATLESIAHQVHDVAEAMGEEGAPVRSLRVDGGGSRNRWLMQFQADLLGIPVQRPAFSETTALGAAYLAGLGAGVWGSLDDLRKLNPVEARWEPQMPAEQRSARVAGWRRALAASRAHGAG